MLGTIAVGAAGSWAKALVNIFPYTFTIAIAVAILGPAWGIYIIGSRLIGAAIKAPRESLIRYLMNC